MDIDKIATQQSESVARMIKTVARPSLTEADFRRELSRILEETSVEAGLTLVPRDEYTVARGRVDSVYNRLVIEYKKPGVLRNRNDTAPNRAVISQIQNYILDVGLREKREAHRLAGVATDGMFFVFVRRVGEGWSVDDPIAITTASTERFLRLLYSLSIGAALIPENLVRDFGPDNFQAGQAVRALYLAFRSTKDPLVKALYEQWRVFFSEATEYKEWADKIESKPEFQKFVKSFWPRDEIKHLTAGPVFFVLHTYYALKLVASLAAARFAAGSVEDFKKLASHSGDDLRTALTDLEAGGLFRQYGIRNFLEGDFFGWYLHAWDSEVERSVSGMLQRLKDYDPGALELAPENARDLLKKLYHNLLPREIRHDLGEYYTPDWLAERLVRQTLGTADLGSAVKRVVDPACGSGTFLVILIKHIRERATREKRKPAELLQAILKNVVGFDLNPLAVIAARTNYLLALGDLLQAREGEIDIPVYQADSVLTPSRPHAAETSKNFSFAFEGEIYRLRTSVGEFDVPSFFAERGRMDRLANLLDDSIETGLSDKAFVGRLKAEANLSVEEKREGERTLLKLYQNLRALHDKGLNGVWARIIKNAFAPLFLDPCDYVIGNPPWVNWEHLPDEYRIFTKPLWEHYGLFPHGGMDTILGKGKKDISMLMTYVSADRYLKAGGKLGFVLSQSLFKTSGAGQGFRRFLLPDNTPFGPIAIDDMVLLNPFEGASNRTAVAVFSKGRPVRYPLSYQYWKKRDSGRGSSIGFDTPFETVTSEKIGFSAWYAQPVRQKDPTSAWIAARRKALAALQNVLGNSPYSGHEGSNTGGANAVYWIDVTGVRPGGLVIVSNITEGAKRKAPQTQAAIEKDLVFPLLRGRDVGRWLAEPSAHILMMQDPNTRRGISEDVVESTYPKTLSYLSRFKALLKSRPAFKRYFRVEDPWWSMFNVSDFTFSPWKVVWREQAASFTAAVVGPRDKKPVVPDHKLMMVEIDSEAEAHYLCAALNSTPAVFAVAAYAVQIQMTTHILDNVAVPQYNAKNKVHRQLSELSKSAHRAQASGKQSEVTKIEAQIDEAAVHLWNLTKEEMKEIRRSLEEM